MSEPVIQVRKLQKTYRSGLFRSRRVDALTDVSLEIEAGRIYGLLGPNGAGKTTLIKILLGIVRKTSGDAKILGVNAGDIAARQRIGYLPENHRIPRHLTGKTALEYYGCLSGLPLAEVRRRMPELLAQVQLLGRERDRVSGYSKGMQQRLGLAQAMLHKPELIILDEPTDGVDPVGRKEIRGVLKRLADEGTSIFLNSHLLQEIELICESVAILVKGQVRMTGSVKELKEGIVGAPMAVRLQTTRSEAAECFSDVSVSTVTDEAENTIDVHAEFTDQSQIDAVIDRLRAKHISIVSMQRREQSLEDAFLKIVSEDQA